MSDEKVERTVEIPEKELEKIRVLFDKLVERIKKIQFIHVLLIPEMMENADGLTAEQIINLIRGFINNGTNEMDAYVFLRLLAYYPKSMTERNLTPTMQKLIPLAYYCSRIGEYPKVSMDNLKVWFNRSKATIDICIRNHSALEQMLSDYMQTQTNEQTS